MRTRPGTRVRSACLSLMSFGLCMCTGTETDNPVIDFESTECKSHSEAALSLPPGIARTPAALTASNADYDGLYCIAWEKGDDGHLTVDVINYASGCGISWELGESRLEDGRLELAAERADCAVAGCGACVYDFTFEVEGVSFEEPLQLDFTELDCHGDVEWTERTVYLQTDYDESGVRCRLQGSAGLELECGRPHFPACSSEGPEWGTCEEQSPCEEGAVCVHENALPRDTCFAACEEDADCLGFEACKDGACRLTQTF